ncbi:MAG: hypothetical protein K0V04_42545 [Deltaproteobacteria bacterium]|nr:hypothetical protein [Deltaproteobacteria bacterium]
MVQTWSGAVAGEIVGETVQFDFAFSNIDTNSPDGLMGPTEVEVEIRIEP